MNTTAKAFGRKGMNPHQHALPIERERRFEKVVDSFAGSWSRIVFTAFIAVIGTASVATLISDALMTPEEKEQRESLKREEALQAEKRRQEADSAREAAVYDKVCGSGNIIGAYVMAQKPIRAQLRSPSSAIFPFAHQVAVVPIGDCRWKIIAYVDAQNGFGAMLRTPWTATIQHNPDSGAWRMISANVGN